ncbi:DeoR/GlpR family DNA-binding transcription regulator [Caulobacter mirabilis]|uniref:DeoR family transcriptional regulator n=1 Tax=Caulobacter mirabilis TaxID=69666 RepID=A0A2D2B0X6_9CAUL|nr:DeoR/GlpR family DNA-binding transcription regulator [Caulobacter mirabilis]ATQ43903.1 DeoR family transcriptional regulator [Caulobacter mirabilis]
MRRENRQREILSRLKPNEPISTALLARDLEVSEETIRRELRSMEKAGAILWMHGAVRLMPPASEGVFASRMQTRAEAKARIAEAAAQHIFDGECVFLDAGSTSCFVARALRHHKRLQVVTNSLEVAKVLNYENGHQLFLAGGAYDPETASFSDHTAQQYLTAFRPSLSVLTVGSIHPQHGLMDYRAAEAEMSRVAYAMSSRVMLVADHSKFNRIAPFHTAKLTEVDILITDREPPTELAPALAHVRVEVVGSPGEPS